MRQTNYVFRFLGVGAKEIVDVDDIGFVKPAFTDGGLRILLLLLLKLIFDDQLLHVFGVLFDVEAGINHMLQLSFRIDSSILRLLKRFGDLLSVVFLDLIPGVRNLRVRWHYLLAFWSFLLERSMIMRKLRVEGATDSGELEVAFDFFGFETRSNLFLENHQLFFHLWINVPFIFGWPKAPKGVTDYVSLLGFFFIAEDVSL